MKTTFFSAALLLACATQLHATEAREQFFIVGADVDAQGHVTATQIDNDVPASIAKLLAKSVRQWQFIPAENDGKPVPAHTFVRTVFRAVPDATGQYRLRITFSSNGPRVHTEDQHPRYPYTGQRTLESAFVLLDATAEPDGRLSDMVVTSRFGEAPMRSGFRNSVLMAAEHWRIEPELVDGKPVATRVRIPVTFLGRGFTVDQIRILREEAHKEDVEMAASDIPLPSEQTVALDSPLKPSNVAAITSAP